MAVDWSTFEHPDTVNPVPLALFDNAGNNEGMLAVSFYADGALFTTPKHATDLAVHPVMLSPEDRRTLGMALLMDGAPDATDSERLHKIRDLHSPAVVPEGKSWMGATSADPDAVPCEGCRNGDPFLDPTWPCDTRKLADGIEL